MIDAATLVEWVIHHGSWLVISVLVAAVVVFLLERKIRRLEARIAALKAAANEFEDTLDKEAILPPTATGPNTVVPGQDNWEDIRSHWRVVRDRLEELITEVDGRRQRTYDRTSRYTYRDIIDMLRADAKLDATTATFLHSMNETFLGQRRNARTTSVDAANAFIERFNRVAKTLKLKPPPRWPRGAASQLAG